MDEFAVNDFDEYVSEYSGLTSDELYDEFMGRPEKPKDEFVYYYGMYYNIMGELTAAAMRLLTWLTFHCEVNSGKVKVQSIVQEELLKELGITLGTYYKALSLLKSKGIIKGGGAKYYVNPAFTWKGTADIRAKFMKVYPIL